MNQISLVPTQATFLDRPEADKMFGLLTKQGYESNLGKLDGIFIVTTNATPEAVQFFRDKIHENMYGKPSRLATYNPEDGNWARYDQYDRW